MKLAKLCSKSWFSKFPLYDRIQLMRYREEVLNVYVAEILNSYGLSSSAESVLLGRKIPDVYIQKLDGLRLAIECKHEKERGKLISQAEERLREDIADICIAIEYHEDLFTAEDLKEKLKEKIFRFYVFYWGKGGLIRHSGNGSLESLAKFIQNVVRVDLIGNDILQEEIERVDTELKKLAIVLEGKQDMFFDSVSVAKVVADRLKVGSGYEVEEKEL